MTGPNQLVEQFGETVTHEYVTDYELDNNGQVDPDSLETVEEEIPAIVSAPSEEDTQRLEGRLSAGSLQLTVPSDQDVRGDRGGRRDRFEIRDHRYEVVDVQDDIHPVTGTEKVTVFADRLGGRS